MKIALVQSNFIPWIGYLAIIDKVDLFLLYEDVQYTKNDWRNRNFFLINGEKYWFTIPVSYKFKQNFNDIKISDANCFIKFKKILDNIYNQTEKYLDIKKELTELFFISQQEKYLKDVNRIFLRFLLDIYNIKTKIIYLTKAPKCESPTSKIINIIQEYNCSEYISGPNAQNYIEENKFLENNIRLTYMDYTKETNKYLCEKNKNFLNCSALQFYIES
jgi:hypothetical protein